MAAVYIPSSAATARRGRRWRLDQYASHGSRRNLRNRSGIVAIVLALYVTYHFIENYVVAPWADGDRLKLSNLAVILACAVGAALAGVIGALIALPVAAVYPAIERIWLAEQLAGDTVREHRAIEHRRAG